MEFIPRLRKKAVKGEKYYYLELTLRAEKLRNYSVYIGKSKPGIKKWNEARERLLDNAIRNLAGDVHPEFLLKEQLLTSGILWKRYGGKLERLSPEERKGIGQFEVSNFVYTTLATEGIEVSKGDVSRAIAASKGKKILKDINLDVSLAMAQGVEAIENKRKISVSFIRGLHRNIMRDFPQALPGEYRKGRAVVRRLDSVAGSASVINFEPAPPERIPQRMEEFVEWYNSCRLFPLERAALAHLKLYLIHPFNDGNKRVSRLLLNKALFEGGFPMLNVSKNEEEYFNALIKSVESGNPKHFVDFVYSVFVGKCSGKPKMEK